MRRQRPGREPQRPPPSWRPCPRSGFTTTVTGYQLELEMKLCPRSLRSSDPGRDRLLHPGAPGGSQGVAAPSHQRELAGDSGELQQTAVKRYNDITISPGSRHSHRRSPGTGEDTGHEAGPRPAAQGRIRGARTHHRRRPRAAGAGAGGHRGCPRQPPAEAPDKSHSK